MSRQIVRMTLIGTRTGWIDVAKTAILLSPLRVKSHAESISKRPV